MSSYKYELSICTSWARTTRLRGVDLIITLPLSALLISIVSLSIREREILSLLAARSFTGRGEQWVNQSLRNQRLILERRCRGKSRAKEEKRSGGRWEIYRNKIKVRFVGCAVVLIQPDLILLISRSFSYVVPYIYVGNRIFPLLGRKREQTLWKKYFLRYVVHVHIERAFRKTPVKSHGQITEFL